MRIALPIWEKRVSPVFDVSEQVLLADVEGRQTLSRDIRPLTTVDSTHRAEALAGWGVELLICGAISQVLEQSLRARDIRVLSRIRGGVEDVLSGYTSERLDDPHFLMPGCQQRRMATAANPHMDSKDVHCCDGLVIDTQELDGAESGLASDHGTAGRRLWVVRDGSAVVGEIEIHEQDHVGRITRLDVDDSWQQGPTSCCLLQQALAYCRQRGLIKVTLGASARTRRAVRLLRCFGFQPSRRRGRQRVLEFYLNLYRLIDEERCASEVRHPGHGGAEA